MFAGIVKVWRLVPYRLRMIPGRPRRSLSQPRLDNTSTSGVMPRVTITPSSGASEQPAPRLSGPAPKGSERRTAKRHLALVVARLRRGLRSPERTALTRDISVSGALVLTRATLQLGDEVELDLMLGEDETGAVQVPGRVVRVEKLTPSERHLWAAKAAVAFDRSIDENEPEIEALATSQQRKASDGEAH